MLLGAFRLHRTDGKPGFYELFAIEEVDDTLQFVVKLAIREKGGELRHETLAYKRKPL